MPRRNLILISLAAAVLVLAVVWAVLKPKSEWVEVIEWSSGRPFDRSQWTFETGFLRNNEEQYYTGGAPANFQVTSEGLNLIARSERLANAAYRKGAADWRQAKAEARYTSTSMISKQAWQNLRVEIVARVKGGKGAWPAIWLRSPNTRGFGEIDLLEQLGRESDTVHSTVHYGASIADRDVKSADRVITGLQGRDVTYVAEVTSDKLAITIDGKPMLEMDRHLKAGNVEPLQQSYNLIINLALGGAWSGQIDDAALPATLTIKSIRISEWRRLPKDKRPVVSAN